MPNDIIQCSAQLLNSAQAACRQPIWIASQDHLNHAINQWKQCSLLGIDTEFIRERTYYPQLALIQVSDGKQVWLIDTVALTEHMSLLKSLLDEQAITKIFHSPREDLEVLQLSIGTVPSPIFDTQAAAALVGHPLQTSYGALLASTLDVHIDKEMARSDWLQRPLSAEQISYACHDVAYLPILAKYLTEQLHTLGRWQWFTSDMDILPHAAFPQIDPDNLYRTISGAGRLDGQALRILQALCIWREETAKTLNLPRPFIIKNDAMVSVADAAPQTLDSLFRMNIMRAAQCRMHGSTILEIVHTAQQQTPLPLIRRLALDQQQLIKKAQKWVKSKAASLGVEPAILASRKDIERWIKSGIENVPDRLKGWRWDVCGRELKNILVT